MNLFQLIVDHPCHHVWQDSTTAWMVDTVSNGGHLAMT